MSAKSRRPGTANSQTPNECVQVVVRCRPMSNRERTEGSPEVVNVYPNRGVVELQNLVDANKEQRKVFTYDAAYDASASQTTLYHEVVFPLVSSVLEGFNGCIFAYGQTGTGKTFTMEGVRGNDDLMGIIPRTFEQIWLHINRTENFQFLVDVSYLEIYMEELRDLLKPNSKHLEVRERGSGVYVPNLHAINCKSVDDMANVMRLGNKNRTVGFTNMNEHSSRSHAIFMIKIEMCDTETNTIKVGKLNLIDLAGSERQSKTGASAERLKEASKINLALSSLGNVISALAENSPHVPYRDSKLTRLLQDSLGGNSKTIMIANIGPSNYNYNETLTTLRYAQRAKNIQNQPVKNEDPQDAKLKEYQEEIERLKRLIAPQQQQRSEKLAAAAKKRVKKPKREPVRRELTDSVTQQQLQPAEEEEKESEGEELSEPESDKENEAEVAKSSEQLERERVENAKLAAKLAELEGQLVRGGKNLLDTYSERQIELEKKLVEIAERKKREIEIQQQLELQEETTLEIRERNVSLEQEVELKKRKLSKCYAKYLALQQELNDCKHDHNQDLRELEMAQNELVKELKRQLLIIDNFVPIEVKQRLYTQAKYDEEQEEWKFASLPMPMTTSDGKFSNKRPVSHPNRRRPISEYAIQEAKSNAPGAIRFRSENILNYELDMPCRTTQEYRTPKVSASLQAVLAQAMQTGDDIDIVDTHTNSLRHRLENIINGNSSSAATTAATTASTGIAGAPNTRLAKSTRSGLPSAGSALDSNRRPPTGRMPVKKPASAYPKARGLVNK
ncbi:kinesin-like protein Klp68D [Drosophila sulfurigaster albostrigata]|uniref:LOW QUALITY PROTEIN: kinesin-like protein Klp68D n=1 Tax=Drosophila nasuta TaxID=42062 RepID=UPI00295EA743|nr:LOW QUALITY PROTEIN: kinesin-like protein Klp68D [Drosophila nasuta]XP_062130898.1 kinesin-like protein Klp68D [Drosophila sulfurigaster albostrigata]